MIDNDERPADLKDALALRKEVQAAEKESRDNTREEMHFNADKDGHWEQYAIKRFKGRVRHQVDLVKPVNESIAADIKKMEYGCTVSPTGGDATKEIAETYEKLCRTISNISNAKKIFRTAADSIIDHGYDAAIVVNDYVDHDSFDQDLIIKPLPNAMDRVWLEGVAHAESIKDIRRGFLDTTMSRAEYKRKFPEGSGQSVGQDMDYPRYPDNEDYVTVCDYFYIKEKTATLHLLSNGKVFDEEKYIKVADDLAAKGIHSTRTRTRKTRRCFMRKFDGADWLTDEKETAFSYIPIGQFLGNYQSIENRAVYYGNTRKLMDPQRQFDYASSRDISDGALAPVDKIAMTPAQAVDHDAQNRRLNEASDPIFLYNPDSKAPAPPFRTGGPQSNQQLMQTMQNAANNIKEISQAHDPAQGNGLAGHSGRAYEILTEKASANADKYKDALMDGIADIYTIVIDAIPRVYDTKSRQVRLMSESGEADFESINEEVYDQESQQMVVMNDLSQGNYAFTVTAGPGYSNMQSKTVESMERWAAIDPTIMQDGADIIYSNMQEPGMSQLAERRRKAMLDAGQIPESQLTDEEREKIADQIKAQQANAQPDPMEQATVAAIMAEVKNLQSEAEGRQVKMQIDMMEQQRKMQETMAKIAQGIATTEANVQKTQSETLSNLRDATGADAIVSPAVAEAYNDVAEDMADEGPIQ